MGGDDQGPKIASPTGGMRRQDIWRVEYRARPYLVDVSEAELDTRFFEVLNNLLILTPAGQIGMLKPQAGDANFIALFTHLMEEYARRGRTFPAIRPDVRLPRPDIVKGAPGSAAIRGRKLKIAGSLFKFGKREHLEALLERGRLRILAAGDYSDPSLSSAIRDDERSIIRHGLRSEVKAEVVKSRSGYKGPLELLGNLTVTTSAATNYYVTCFACSFEHRLFDDFNADAALYIRNRMKFRRRLIRAVEAALPGWTSWDQHVSYIDPFRPPKDVDVFFGKHLRFSNQREYRFVWWPPNATQHLEPIFVELGPLLDIAEILLR